MNSEEEKVIEFVSKKLANGKRIQELYLSKRMLAYAKGMKLLQDLNQTLSDEYAMQMDESQRQNLINVMTNEFPAGSNKGTYVECIFIEKNPEEVLNRRTCRIFSMRMNEEFRCIYLFEKIKMTKFLKNFII